MRRLCQIATRHPHRSIRLRPNKQPMSHHRNLHQTMDYGKKIITTVRKKEQLERIITKSDSCSIEITDIDLYIPPSGDETEQVSIYSLMKTFCEKMNEMNYVGVVRSSGGGHDRKLSSSGLSGGDKMSQYIERVTYAMENPNFTVVLDDPLGNSDIELLDNENLEEKQIQCYERSSQMNEEYGIADDGDTRRREEPPPKIRQMTLRNISILTDNPDRFELQDRVLLGKTSAGIIKSSFQYFAKQPCVGYRKRNADGLSNEYEWMTYEDVFALCVCFTMGVRQIVPYNSFVGILGSNCLEWLLADLACLFSGYTSTPLHSTFSVEQMEHIVNQTGLNTIICIGEDMTQKALTLVRTCPSIRTIISDTQIDDQIITFDSLIRNGREITPDPSSFTIVDRKKEDIVTLVYTSGSTGFPKGSVCNEHIWYEMLQDVKIQNSRSIDPLIQISYMPLSHLTDRKLYLQGLCKGGQTGLYSGSIESLFDDLKLLRPTILLGPPRIWSFIYSQYQSALNHRLLQARMDVDGVVDTNRIELDLKKEFSSLLGGRTEYIVTGGAYTSDHVKEFISDLFDCDVFDGYGTSESGGIASNGELLSHVEFKLLDVPDMGYTSEDKPNPRGEIVVKTGGMVTEYYKDPENTNESFTDDGYFRTGDIGELLENGKVRIIDRKKFVFKLQQGEFISPSRIEGIFLESTMIDQIFIHGEMDKSYLLAVVVPNQQVIELGLTKEELRAKIYKDVIFIAKRKEIPPYEVPRDITLELDESFTPGNSLLTPSFKLNRPNLLKKYRGKLNEVAKNIDTKDFELESQLLRMVSTVLDKEGISAEQTDFTQVGGDSISAIRLIELIKRDYNITVPKEELFKESYLRNIANHIKNKDFISPSKPKVIDFSQDIYLDITKQCTEYPTHINAILLTGATGFLGSHLLEVLLSSTQVTVYCLVRESTRTKTLLQQCKDQSRIIPIFGSLSEPLLGLSLQQFEELAQNIDAIIHNGALVNAYLPYEAHKSTNVDGTREIIRLSVTGRVQKHIHYVSSTSIFPSGCDIEENFNVREDSFQPQKLVEGYAQSKNVAEQIIAIAIQQHSIPITIYRPGMISSSSLTGRSNITDWVSRLFYTFLIANRVPQFPDPYSDAEGVLELCPVDFVSQFIVSTVVRHNIEGSQSFNILNPHSMGIQWKDFVAVMRAYKPDIVVVKSYSEWFDLTKQHLHDNLLESDRDKKTIWPMLDMFIKGVPVVRAEEKGRYHINNTVHHMEKIKLECTPITSDVIIKTLSSLNQQWLSE